MIASMLAGAVLVALAGGVAPARHAQVGLIGTWRGTSTCVDKLTFPACTDEVVVYVAQPLASSPDSVSLLADKVVNGVREPMGELRYGPAGAGTWQAEFRTARVHLRWTLRVEGDQLTGTLVDMPSGKVARTVSLRRVRE